MIGTCEHGTRIASRCLQCEVVQLQKIADGLRAQLASRKEEAARLLQRITEQSYEIQRLTGYTLAGHNTSRDRAQRINDLAADGAFAIHAARLAQHDRAVYTGRLSAIESPSRTALMRTLSVNEARALAKAVVEAEE